MTERQDPDRDETPTERADRNLSELLQELRVAQLSTQVLFAFLLTVPFSTGFKDLSQFGRTTYFVVLMLAAAAAAFMIAPTGWHRVLFRQRDKRYLVSVSNRLAICGLALAAAAMIGAVLFITDFLYSPATVRPVVTVAAAVFIGLWFAGPIARRMRLGRRQELDEYED